MISAGASASKATETAKSAPEPEAPHRFFKHRTLAASGLNLGDAREGDAKDAEVAGGAGIERPRSRHTHKGAMPTRGTDRSNNRRPGGRRRDAPRARAQSHATRRSTASGRGGGTSVNGLSQNGVNQNGYRDSWCFGGVSPGSSGEVRGLPNVRFRFRCRRALIPIPDAR
jgi:hypothetical protein